MCTLNLESVRETLLETRSIAVSLVLTVTLIYSPLTPHIHAIESSGSWSKIEVGR